MYIKAILAVGSQANNLNISEQVFTTFQCSKITQQLNEIFPKLKTYILLVENKETFQPIVLIF